MSLTNFDSFSENQLSTLKDFISKVIDERLKDYILIPKQHFIDEQGYKYIFTEEELNATKEILRDEDFLESIIRGDEDFRRNRFRKWSDVRENV